MSEIKEIGKYNVNFCGLSYDGNIPYEMVIIEEFNGNVPVKGNKKTLYFRQNIGTKRKYIMPMINTETEVKQWLQYRNYSKIQIYNKLVIEEAE